MKTAITADELERLLNEGAPVKVLDVRLPKDRAPVDHPVPGAEWRNPEEVESWRAEVSGRESVVVYCVHGHQVSQEVCEKLRAGGLRSRYLEGGIAGWCGHIGSRGPGAGED